MIAPRSLAPLLAVAAVSLACGNNSRDVKSCAADPECPSGAYCVGGACVAGLLPEAHIQIAGAAGQLTSHRTIVFDGSGSVDPNPQHRLTTFNWSLKQASAVGCDPTRKAGTDARLETMFPCAGDYHVELKVANSLGLESAMTQAITVGPSANAPVIDSVSPDLVLAHRCAGTPLRCAAVGDGGATSFQLDVRAHDVEDGAALAYRWEVDAPPGAEAGAVAFDPSPSAQSPRVSIGSAGASVSGTWVLRAVVSDGDQLQSAREVRISVANTAPTLALAGGETAVALDHIFADHVYRVTGTVHLVAADADGDALRTPVTTLGESAPTGCHFDVASTVATGDGFDVAVGMTCETAAALSPTIGGAVYGAGVERALTFSVDDGQGASAGVTVPFTVKDRPPVFLAPLASTTHSTGSCPFPTGWCFVASGAAPVPTDPDGDEVRVTAVARGADPHVGWSSSEGAFTLVTDGLYPASFRTADGVHPVAISAIVADPWRTTTLPFRLAIPNAAPVVTALVLQPFVTYDGARYVAGGAAATVVDPDGDPVTLASSTGTCAASVAGGSLQATCARAYAWGAGGPPELGTFLGSALNVTGTVSDPWSETRFSEDVRPLAPAAPAVSAATQYVTPICRKVCPAGEACEVLPFGCRSLNFVPSLDASVPVSVTATLGGSSASFMCFGGQCTGSLPMTVCGGEQVTVTLRDGISAPPASIVATRFGDCP